MKTELVIGGGHPPRESLEPLIATAARAFAMEHALDDILAGVDDQEMACVSCACTWTEPCAVEVTAMVRRDVSLPASRETVVVPCSWREDHGLPLCSSCAPPLVVEPAVLPSGDSTFVDVEDEVLRQFHAAKDNTLTLAELHNVDLPHVSEETLLLVVALLVEDGLLRVTMPNVFTTSGRGAY